MPLPIQINGDLCEQMELDVIENDELDHLPIVDEVVDYDLKADMQHYTGQSKIQRLEYIADHCKSLQLEALKLAIEYITKNTCNVKDYTRLFKKYQDALIARDGSGTRPPQIDNSWIDTMNKQTSLRYERLDSDLKNYRNNSIRESIRRGQDDLGDHYLDIGELEQAFTNYSKSRDLVSTSKNQVMQCLNMIRVSILLRRWPAVSSHVVRAGALPPGEALNPNVSTKIYCAAGLYELNAKKYKKAAISFLNTIFDQFSLINDQTNVMGSYSSNQSGSGQSPCSSTSANPLTGPFRPTGFDISGNLAHWDLLSPVNIAIYGTLCALATFSRKELSERVINSSAFKQFLELHPQLREAAQKFHDSKYASCLQILDRIKNSLLIDMFLASHVERIYRLIRDSALIRYFEPYSVADMRKMAVAFNTNVAKLESEVITLIDDGRIKGRIDSHDKILYAKDVDPRTTMFEHALEVGENWQRQTRGLIGRNAITNSGLQLNSSNP